MKATGFKAFCVYCHIKHVHFSNSKHSITKVKGTPLKNKLIGTWNKTKYKVDGRLFLEVEKKYPHTQKMGLLYSSYYMNNSKFYIRDMIEEEYEQFRQNTYELKNIEQTFTNDLQNVIVSLQEDKCKFQDILTSSTSIPQIFKMNL